jgi:hypothetical protein
MAEVVSRHQAMAEAMDAERQLVAGEATEAKPDNEVSAAARALRNAGLAKKAMAHPKEQAVQQEEIQTADKDETTAPADAEQVEDDPPQDEEPAEGQALIVEGKRVTVEDLKRDYVPRVEYSRKTGEVSQFKQQFAVEAQNRLQRLDQQIQALQTEVGSEEPDWAQVAAEKGNDQAFSEQLAWNAKSKKLQQAANLRRQESQRLMAQAVSERDNELAESYNTAWKDPAVRQKDYETIAKYAFEQGFTPEETAMMTAARYLSTLDKARKFDEAVAAGNLAKPGLVKKPAVLKPNARSPQTQSKNPLLQKELEAFNKNPTREGYMKVSNLSVVQ